MLLGVFTAHKNLILDLEGISIIIDFSSSLCKLEFCIKSWGFFEDGDKKKSSFPSSLKGTINHRGQSHMEPPWSEIHIKAVDLTIAARDTEIPSKTIFGWKTPLGEAWLVTMGIILWTELHPGPKIKENYISILEIRSGLKRK